MGSRNLILLIVINVVAIFAQQLTCGPNGKVVVTETELDSSVQNVYWVSPDFQTIWITTTNRNVYKSSNGGQTWESQLSYMEGAADGSPNGVYSLHTTSDSNVTYFLGFSDKMWITKDGGATYQVVPTAGHDFVNIATHPTHPNWLLASDYSPACFEADPSPNMPACNQRLYLSQSFGREWVLVDTYIYIYTWANAGLNGVPDKTIWLLDWPDKTGPQYDANGILRKDINNLELQHSVDFLTTIIQHPINNVIFFLYLRNNMYFARLVSTTLELHVSQDNGETFKKANFPFKDLREIQYTILDDTEGQVFMSVAHGTYAWGNIYTSGSLGSNYDLSLEYNRRDRNGNSDFSKVKSLDGVYLANALQNVRDFDSGSGAKTLVTFNKGGIWTSLDLPLGANGTPVKCDEIDCSLNLHVTEKKGQNFYYTFGPIHSRSQAVGLMLATGNIGTTLNLDSFDSSDVHTYLTRDGGWTWYDIKVGSYIYEFADHGAIILMADNVHPTDTATFTSNEGLNFMDCKFTNLGSVEVHNIIVEPNVKSQEFIMHGVRVNSDGEDKGVIFHFNFDHYFNHSCIYPDDYENFSPSDSKDSTQVKCHLGQTSTYSRRKRDADCYNPDEYEKVIGVTRCPCAKEDYQCDFCYEKQSADGICGKVADCVSNSECIDGYYNLSRGYRLVTGDNCDATPPLGLDLLPTRVACDNSKGSNNKPLSAGAIVLIVFFVLSVVFGGIGIAFYFYRKKAGFSFSSFQTRKTIHYEDESTALDDDLLEAKEADELDDNALKETIGRKLDESFNPRRTSRNEPTLFTI